MTKEEFYSRLRYHALDWGIREGEVRAVDRKGHCFCPVTGVCFMETGEFYPEDRYEDAAKRLGLTLADAQLIADEADSPEPEENGVVATLNLGDTLREIAYERACERRYNA